MKSCKSPSAEQICFGLNEEVDRKSFSIFLQLAGKSEVAEVLASRIEQQEITQFVDLFSSLLRTHFTEKEYHDLFLGK